MVSDKEKMAEVFRSFGEQVDLVDKLRSGACAPDEGCHPRWCACAWMQEAADEIERLRSLVGDLKQCDCCGEWKEDVRRIYAPHVGDTNACEDCRNPEKWRQRT